MASEWANGNGKDGKMAALHWVQGMAGSFWIKRKAG